MRWIADVPNPQNRLKRLMIYECTEGVYLFGYSSHEDCSGDWDEWYESVTQTKETCLVEYGISASDWTKIPDPLKNCQHDWIAPMRLKDNVLMNLNEQLVDAVTFHCVPDVKYLLEQGANPNYETFLEMPESERKNQPYTPLRLVIFCISDSLLEDDGLRDFAEIARILIQYGAKTKPAMELAELRYGKYQPNKKPDLFMQVWDVVAIADQHSGA